MISLKASASLFIGFIFLTGCSAESPKRLPLKAVEKETISEVAPLSKDSFRPALDVLFVIDDSGSMAIHQ